MPVFLFSIDIAKISYFIENSRKTLLILVKLRSALLLEGAIYAGHRARWVRVSGTLQFEYNYAFLSTGKHAVRA